MSNYLKKCLTIMLILAFILSMTVGCGQKAEQQPDQSEKTTSEVKTEEAAKEEAMKPEDLKGSVSMWGWDETAAKALIVEFNKKYPNVQVDYVPVAGGDFLKKIQTSFAAGMDLPDIGWQERNQRGALYELDIWEDLTKAPYNFDKSVVFDFSIPQVTNSKGITVGVPWDISVGALAYKRDLAKQYFGTDDRKELEKLFSDWDAFIAKGKEVKEKSGGKVFMFPGTKDVMYILDGQISLPVVNGNKLDMANTWAKTLDLIVKMRDAGLTDKLDQWSSGWNASLAGKNHIFYPCAIWFPHYVIESNDKNGKGNWGLMVPPGGGFTWGGTAMGITKNSKTKEQAWAFIDWCMLSEEGIKANKEKVGFYSYLKKAYDDPSYASFKTDWFGAQDIGEVYFKELASKMEQVRPASKYDSICDETSILISKALNADLKFDAATATAKFAEELKNKAQELE